MTEPAVAVSPGRMIRAGLVSIGDWTSFALHACRGVLIRSGQPGGLVPVCYSVGVASVPVIAVTGFFIGMVLAVQAFGQYQNLGLATWLGSMIHQTLIRELGPVLAAVMLAGRVGSAMAAEVGTMRVTDQIDALSCLGVDPIHYLVVPRLIACVLLIPLLSTLANATGILGAATICLGVYGIDPHHYWQHGRDMLDIWDVVLNLVKPLAFGAYIALASCYSGFHCTGGSEGVGRAATQAFVRSFLGILVLDFFLGLTISAIKIRILVPEVIKLT